MCKRKMYAIFCKESTEPSHQTHGACIITHYSKVKYWLIKCIGMFSVWGHASSRKSWYTTLYTNFENWISQFTLDYGMENTWNGCFMYMAYSFVNHQMEQGFECVVTQLLSHSSIHNLNSIIRSVSYVKLIKAAELASVFDYYDVVLLHSHLWLIADLYESAQLLYIVVGVWCEKIVLGIFNTNDGTIRFKLQSITRKWLILHDDVSQ